MHSKYISQVPEWQIVSDFKAARKDEGGSDANRHLIRAKLQRVSKCEVCVSVCCATLLSQLVGPACVQTRSSNQRGRACRPSGKDPGRRGY